jgi:hypothetical protein
MTTKEKKRGTSLFGIIGFLLGLSLGYDLSQNWVFALILGGVMTYVGIAVEIILIRILAFFIALLILLARHELLGAIFENL